MARFNPQATAPGAGGSSASGTGGGSWEVVFHRDTHHVARPVAVAIAAGAAHSCVITAAGAVLAWRSMDPALQAVEVGGPLAGRAAASVAAGRALHVWGLRVIERSGAGLASSHRHGPVLAPVDAARRSQLTTAALRLASGIPKASRHCSPHSMPLWLQASIEQQS